MSARITHVKASYYDAYARVETEHWWFRVRREMIHNLIGKYTKSKDLTILDMGCGTGALLKELSRYGRASGVDFSDRAVEFCKSRGIADVQQARAESLPFPDKVFDVVLALDVIEHIEDDKAALKELERVTKTGGIIIIFVPAFMFLWGITDEASNHFRRYTKQELIRKVEDTGAEVVRASYFNTFLFLPILLVRWGSRFMPKAKRPEHEVSLPSGIMNKIFYSIFKLESMIFRYSNFPFGVSLAVIAKKP